MTYIECIKLNKTSLSMNVGENRTLTATVCPTDATNQTLAWSSDNESVATVDQNGVVHAVSHGMTYINACSTDGNGAIDSCCVMVYDPTVYVECVKLNYTSLSMNVGENRTLIATVCPTDATNQTLVWSSDSPEIATVDEYGNVCAVAPGMTHINACSTDGNGAMDSCCVMVYGDVAVESVTVNHESLLMNIGTSITLNATVSPHYAADKAVKWSSNNANIATVNEDSGVVTAIAEGQAVITVTTNDGGKTASCVVTVRRFVESVTVTPSSITLNEGDTHTLTSTVLPDNATIHGVTWSSSNTSVATVNAETGEIRAVGAGGAKIYATATDGSGVKSFCTVGVDGYVPAKSIDITGVRILQGESTKLAATVYPTDSNDKIVRWDSNDSKIAIVGPYSGEVFAIKKGTTTITASHDEINKSAKFNVEVYDIPVDTVTITADSDVVIKGKTLQLKATVCPSNASNKGVTWESSNKNVATVDENGLVHANYPGTTVITATADYDSRIVDAFTVRVVYDIVRIEDEKGSSYRTVTFNSTGKVWYCIDADMIFDLNNMSNNSLIDRSKRNLFENPNYSQDELRVFEREEIKLLYAIDPFGVSKYIFDIGEKEYLNDIIRKTDYKDDWFRFIFGRDPLYFDCDYDGNWFVTNEEFNYEQMLSESEALFGKHKIDNETALKAFIEIVVSVTKIAVEAGSVVATAIFPQWRNVFETTADVINTAVDIQKYYVFEKYGVEYNVLEAMYEVGEDIREIFDNSLTSILDDIIDTLNELVDLYTNINEIYESLSSEPEYFKTALRYYAYGTEYDIIVKLNNGTTYRIKDINNGIFLA